MKLAKLAVLAAAGLTITACSSITNSDRSVTLNDSFSDNLRTRYIELADWEDEQGDYIDGNWYTRKAQAVIAGELVEPTTLENRELPTEHLNELAQARNALVSVLARGAATVSPEAAAEAQTKFDCWVEQAEENFQPEHIEMCRIGFFEAMKKIQFPEAQKAAADAAPAPIKVEATESRPAEFIVFFEFDKSELTSGGHRVVYEVAKAAKMLEPARIIVSGHADRSGKMAYNNELSKKRAIAVATKLAEMGVPRDVLALQSFGEDAPRVPTADGVKEAGNRFVKIVLAK